ncbi:chalcone isomerase family protein [Colwellia sp. RSH04]|uniref:chalcone isomerase family protein n=1 Tax=Colwellia sp. RSH04 TaxID=2305464 RepID=UPI000E56E85E|nr:chalcone isomerase family protein [Colwellia sp. RSH04]RHW75039.1 hypothetical protein D1094_15555 [Colwellia sp. RSH04]
MLKKISVIFVLSLTFFTAFQTNSSESRLVFNLNNVIEKERFIETGQTTFSLLFWDLYTSKLMTTSGNYPIGKDSDKLIFQIQYLADISSKDLIDKTIEQWQHIGLDENDYKHYINELNTIWPNIMKGDSLALLMEKDKSLFYFNNQFVGLVDDPNFGQLFIDIWLSEKTSQPSLRDELLGGVADE